MVAHVAVSITFNYVFVEAEKKEEDKDDGEIGFVSHGASWARCSKILGGGPGLLVISI